MNSPSKKKAIKDNHPLSFQGVYKTYGWVEIQESYAFFLSIFISLALVVVVNVSSITCLDFLEKVSDIQLSVIPSLLGFNLGGYALIIGFGNSSFVKSISKPISGKKYSLFQKISAVFAFTLLLQVTTFIFALITNLVINLKLVVLDENFAWILNNLVLALTLFIGLWSLLILPNLIANVFTFGQMNHFHIQLNKLKEENAQREQTNT